MMEIKVSYTTTVEQVIEVDEKFHGLTDSGGWDEMSNQERDQLTDELLTELTDRIDVGYHDIIGVEEWDTGEVMYEG